MSTGGARLGIPARSLAEAGTIEGRARSDPIGERRSDRLRAHGRSVAWHGRTSTDTRYLSLDAMLSFSQLVSLFEAEGDLVARVDLPTVLRYIRLTSTLKPDILHAQVPSFDPESLPYELPSTIASYICQRLGLKSDEDAQSLWRVFGMGIWKQGVDMLGEDSGFWVRDRVDAQLGSEVRTYYAGIPDAIQVAEHTYIERRVLELFNSLTLFAWTSATNAAHIYHHSLSRLPDSRRHIAAYQLRTEQVWDGYVALALLKDAAAREYVLEVPHVGDQKDRFTAAMRARNEYIRQFGQPEFMHFCTKCVRRFDHTDGTASFVDVVVTDGLEMGRPCCSVRHCTEELLTTQDRYCPSHRHLSRRCVIDGCLSPSETGFKTCKDLVHREVETWNQLHGKAMFSLRHALLRSKVSNPVDAVNPVRGPDEHLDVTVNVIASTEPGRSEVQVHAAPLLDNTQAEPAPITDNSTPSVAPRSPLHTTTDGGPTPPAFRVHSVDPPGVAAGGPTAPSQVPVVSAPAPATCPDKPAATTRSMRAMFGRRRTHNEQLLIRPCGIIVKRATFYGSETTPQVLSLYRETYPFPEYAPSYLIYDNGCGLYKHSKACGETLHEEIGLPVDVFHWKCKHKKSDEACSRHCNPYSFAELRVDDDGNWFFNSSIAEQTNVWFGGYHAIVREMTAVKYDFFLDEVIKDKNKLTRSKLMLKGCAPGLRPLNN
ncbi:hypothetical protein LXA43DRAFT_1151824 [Ganoderma leucocontextum]|nr:hypothetical protein LXA43DRAFT_1151824 [Ganoderma leucocontextum]